MASSKDKRLSKLLGGFFGAACMLAMFAVGAWFAYNSIVLVTRGEKATATCTKITTKRDSEGHTRSTHHVSYTTADGKALDGTIDTGFSVLMVGQTIEVLYDPLKPTRVQANRFMSLWFMPAMFGGIATLAAFGAVSAKFRNRARKARRELAGTGNDAMASAGLSPVDATASRARSRSTGLKPALISMAALLTALAASWSYDRFAPAHRLGLTGALAMCVPFGLIITAVIATAARLSGQRQSAVAQAAQELGWQATSSELPKSTPEFPFFTSHPTGHFEHVLLSPDADDPLLAVFEWTESSDDGTVTRRELCAIYPLAIAGLPDMLIRPEMLEYKLATWIGYSDIDFEGSETLMEFSRKYLVRSDDEPRVRELVDDRLARMFLDHPGWTIESKDGSLLVRWQRMQSFRMAKYSLRDAASIKAFLEESRVIAAGLREAAV